MSQTDRALENILSEAEQDEAVIAVIQFGSSTDPERDARDVDIAIVLDRNPGEAPWDIALRYKAHASGQRHEGLDVSIFQTLPIYVRQRVLSEAEPLLVKDHDQLYEIAFQTIREFERFKPHYQEYLEAVARG